MWNILGGSITKSSCPRLNPFSKKDWEPPQSTLRLPTFPSFRWESPVSNQLLNHVGEDVAQSARQTQDLCFKGWDWHGGTAWGSATFAMETKPVWRLFQNTVTCLSWWVFYKTLTLTCCLKLNLSSVIGCFILKSSLSKDPCNFFLTKSFFCIFMIAWI